jgi:NADH-quinone oxidoreductase subunit L
MITRLNYLFDLAPDVQNIIAIIGAVTSLSLPLSHWFKLILKVLAYSTVSQLGLMFLACWRIRSRRFSCNYTFFKASLFLGSGSVIHALHGEQDMRKWVD